LSETVDGKALHSTCQFATKDENPFADMVYRLVIGGYLNATSVGFRPLKWSWNEERGSWAIDYTEQELLEYSVVPVPANPDALIEARGKGIDMAPLIGWAEKTLDAMGDGLPGLLIPRATLEAARKAAGAPEAVHFAPLKMDATGRPVQSLEFRAATDVMLLAGKAEKAADGQGERFLLPMTAETSYPPFPWDATFLARMRPDQAPHYYAALTGAASLPKQSFKLLDLTATQNRVDTAKVQAMRGGDALRAAAPVVVRMNGRFYIADGHHGLTAAWLDGADAFECGFKDLDAATDG
ncbi:HK97 family phage prohead protease, partial [Azospirillum tabaci]|uniref:HK97 family phage prohead protease n=1 Tax=Azospirillum tabaci TaxID=2752310 RepID=UPI00166032B5